ncbi:MAG: hypothetical protein KDN05_00360 [Verrucomicrobiae bacterium]|nr:hypothetical protein [Verrucomicrobiae bacterium]
MRRYTASLSAHEPKGKKDRGSILGETRWGDAKRVEAVFGIRRGVLRRLLIEGKIQSKHLEVDRPNSDDAAAVRAKRLYSFKSIEDYLETGESSELQD